MGIRTKNLHNIIIPLKCRSTLSATTDKDCAKVPFSGFITNIAGAVGTADGSTNSVIDINLNGTTIFADATKVTIAKTTGVFTYSALSTTPTAVTYGSVLSLDIDSCGTGTVNAVVDVTISRAEVYTADGEQDEDKAR
jgi:hypothetical protein